MALKWEDVDLEGGELHVNAALEQTRAAVTRQQPKTQRSRRIVPLTPSAVALLRRHRAAQDALRLAKGVFWHDEGYTFPSDLVTQSKYGGRMWTPDASRRPSARLRCAPVSVALVSSSRLAVPSRTSSLGRSVP